MAGLSASSLKGISRLVLETSVFVVVVAQAICWLSGWSLLDLLNHREMSSTRSSGLPTTREFGLSPAVKDMMKQMGIVHSACYEEGRNSSKEFLLCVGRANCAHAKTGDTRLVAAPEILASPEGKRKILEVTHTVLSHVARQEQTSDLKVIMEKISALGLACDNLSLP